MTDGESRRPGIDDSATARYVATVERHQYIQSLIHQRHRLPDGPSPAPRRVLIVLVPLRWGCYDRSMAEAIAFETHRFVKRLTENGFTEQQAETLAEEHVAIFNANLATKADIARIEAGMGALRQGTKTAVAGIEAGMEAPGHGIKAAIEAMKADFVKWLFGALIVHGGLVVALIKLL